MVTRDKHIIATLDEGAADLRRANAELRRQLDDRTAERDEAVAQQSATAEVLQVINASPGDLTPVFDAMLEKAIRLCEAAFGILWTYDGKLFQAVSFRNVPHAYAEFLHEPHRAGPLTGLGRVAGGEPFAHITDMLEDDAYRRGDPVRRAGIELAGARTHLSMPLRKDHVLLGNFALFRNEVRPFTDKQIALVQNFAAQAVIAMENARLLGELRERTGDLEESLEYQTATSDVLKVISRSTFDLQPVLDALLATASRLCGNAEGALAIRQGEVFRYVATVALTPEFDAALRQRSLVPDRGSTAGRVALEGRVVQIADIAADPEYALPEVHVLGKLRTTLGVPLVRQGETIGVITLAHRRVQPFTDQQIALVSTFADQAVIAMENARLLGELRERTGDLEESLEYQTATSDVLKVISRSTFDLQPVLDTLLQTAARLCSAEMGHIAKRDGDVYRVASTFAFSPEWDVAVRKLTFEPGRGSVVSRTLLARHAVQIADLTADPEFALPEVITIGGMRTGLGVPLLREGEPIGVVYLARQRVEPFTERQIELVRTFADQAVIAIENTRLITETREALDQQTATAEILRVISSSPSDLQPVFQAIADSAAKLCNGLNSSVYRFDGELIHFLAESSFSPQAVESTKRLFPAPPSRGNATARAVFDRAVVHIPDIDQDSDYLSHEWANAIGARSVLSVPMLRDGRPIGTITVNRREARPFPDAQIELLKTFAGQAVIAIENARLLGDLREALDQQTATAEVLQVINNSPGDLVPVFTAVLDTALHLCGAAFGDLYTYDGVRFRPVALQGASPEYTEHRMKNPPNPSVPGTVSARILETKQPFQVLDLKAEEVYGSALASRRVLVDVGGARTQLAVPLLKDEAVLGYITIYRREVRAFSEKQTALLRNFAAQAVIAMENARLLGEIRAARDTAETALRGLKAAQANLIQAEKMASLGQLTAGIAHEIKNPLNFVNNFANLSVELLDELKAAAGPAIAGLGEDTRAEIDETIGMLTGNLEKIAEHGRRADGIVRSMLEHSRGGSGERRSVDLNNLVEEALNLAYHGARAQDQSFNITLEREFDNSIAPVELVPQDVTRVFLNLFGNGFYAATKRRIEADDSSFKPTVTVTTRDLGDAVEIRVRDNGIGISAEIKDKLFQPFFTTKPTGEGTGLGLSISYDIVTQQHGGTIAVDSRIGEFTEFTIRLPRAAAVAPPTLSFRGRPEGEARNP